MVAFVNPSSVSIQTVLTTKNTTQYHMVHRSLLAAFAGAIGLALATPTSAAIILFKVYDDTTGFDNSVDRNANGNPISATGPDDYLGFKADVATAFDNGMGGVWRTNRGGTGPTQDPGAPALNVPFTSQTLSFAGGTKTIDVSFNTNMRIESYGSATAISGYDELDTSPGSATQPWTMTLGPVVGGDPNERVVRLAITQLSRLDNTVGMTVTLDDSSTLSLTNIFLAGQSLRPATTVIIAQANHRETT